MLDFLLSSFEKRTVTVEVWWCRIGIAKVKGDDEERRGGEEGQNGNGREEREGVSCRRKENQGNG